MARYDWPHATDLTDEGFEREDHLNDRFGELQFIRPDGSFPPVVPPPPDPRPTNDDLWLPIGPSVVLGGQASGGPRVSGRTREIAVEPTDGHRLYAASGSGGVWYSDSRGVAWEPLDNFAASPNRNSQTPVGNSLSCGAIHVEWGAAEDGSQDTVVVGTGEGSTGSRGTPGPRLAGVGVIRATGPAVGTTWDREAIGDGGDIDLRGAGFYRIVGDPGDPTLLLAATTRGLKVWTDGPLALWSSAGPAVNTMDVAVTRHAGPARVRVWIVRNGSLFVGESTTPSAAPVIDPTTITFARVTLPNSFVDTRPRRITRLALAVGADPKDLWVLGRRPATGTATLNPAHLWHVDAAMDLSGTPSATEVSGAPERLFHSATGKDQSSYDMAIAAHPSVDDRLWVAGSTIYRDGSHNASMYQLAVTRTTTGGNTTFDTADTWIGKGVHADVHSLKTGPSPSASHVALWVGCDGGVFLSDRDGDPDTFHARNTGMANLEAGFVGSHPTNDGIVGAGMQDNGTCIRSGDTVWVEPFKGDGGAIVYDPTHPNRYIRQYTKASWRVSDRSGISPVSRRRLAGDGDNSQKLENSQSSFYSGADAVEHGGTVHLALGTTRVWYTDDWGRSWVSLPTGTDPRAELAADMTQDVIEQFGSDINFEDTVEARSFLCCDDTETGRTKKGRSILSVKWGVRSTDGGRDRIRLTVLTKSGPSGIVLIEGSRTEGASGAWTWDPTMKRLPIRGPRRGAVSENADFRAGNPLAFLAASGRVNDVAVHEPDRGANGSFYVATIGSGISGSGFEIDTLWWYDGAGTFRPCGLRRQHARGVWADPTSRITAPAHSVIVDPVDRNVVFVGTSVGVVKGVFSESPDPAWAWSRFDNNLPEAVVHDLSIHHHDGLHLMRAALGSRGVWEVDLADTARPRDFLRLHPLDTRRRVPTPLDGPTTNGATGLRWDASPDIVIDQTSFIHPVGPLEPTIVGLPTQRVGEGVSAVVESTDMRVHVLVHHRWHEAAEPENLKVVLVRRELEPDGSAPLGALWDRLVALSGGGPVADPLPDGWVAAGSSLVAPVAAAATARTPRSATFDVDLSAVAGRKVVLLAVVLSDVDPLTANEDRLDGTSATTVEELVLRSHHCAARTIRADA